MKQKYIKRSFLAVGGGTLALGLLIAGPVGAQEVTAETFETPLYIGQRIETNGQQVGKRHRLQRFSQEMIQEMADFLGVTVEEFQAAKNDPELREQYKDRLQLFHETKIAERAVELGLTVEELEARQLERHGNRPIDRGPRLSPEELAEELGVTIEDFQAAKDDPELREQIRTQLEGLRQTHLAERAAELGMTVQELQKRIQDRKNQRPGPSGMHRPFGGQINQS